MLFLLPNCLNCTHLARTLLNDNQTADSQLECMKQSNRRFCFLRAFVMSSRAAKVAAIQALMQYDDQRFEDDTHEDDQVDVVSTMDNGETSEDVSDGDHQDDFIDEEYILDVNDLVDLEIDADELEPDDASEFPSSDIFLAPSGTQWTQNVGPDRGRANATNVFVGSPFQVKRGIHPTTERESVLMFFDEIIDDSVIYTNLYARRRVGNYNRQNNSSKVWKATDRVEIEAFFGLLILAGAFKAHHRSTVDLWSQRDGQPIFRATMSRQRFCELKSFLRFDDTLRRDRNDSLAPVRKTTDHFLLRLREFVTAPEYLTVDEQLLEFHGRVKFRQYIASKPGKFGIKIYWISSSGGEYVFNGLVYIGAGSINDSFVRDSAGHGEAVVKQLIDPFLDNGRNVTLDNFFTSVHLADDLRARNTTLVGTVRRNNRSVPSVANDVTGRTKGDSRYYFSDSKMLCSFWDKGNKPVLLLDTFKPTVSSAEEQNAAKPSTVQFYNATKSGVDIIDKKVRAFSCKRKCRRWPFAVVCNFLDISCINGSFIFNKVHGQSNDRLSFLISCGYQLADSQIKSRMRIPKALKEEVVMAMRLCGYKTESHVHTAPTKLLQKPRRCEMCPTKADRKSKSVCGICKKVICVEHSVKVCMSCCEKND